MPSTVNILVDGHGGWTHEANGDVTVFIDGDPYMPPYDQDMDIDYTEDATSFDVEITVIDPETGESAGATVDNLTNAMYWIVQHKLLPIREGYRERTAEDFTLSGYGESEAETPHEHLASDLAKSLHAGWRAQNLQPIILTITCHGDPELIRAGL